MSKNYETGTRNQVLRSAILHGIRDRESLVDCWTPGLGDPFICATENVSQLEALIRDYMKVLKTIPND